MVNMYTYTITLFGDNQMESLKYTLTLVLALSPLQACGQDPIVGYWSANCAESYFDFDGKSIFSFYEVKSGQRPTRSTTGTYLVKGDKIHINAEGNMFDVTVLERHEDLILVDVLMDGELSRNVIWSRCK